MLFLRHGSEDGTTISGPSPRSHIPTSAKASGRASLISSADTKSAGEEDLNLTRQDELREIVLQIDAIILRGYKLPARLELKLFSFLDRLSATGAISVYSIRPGFFCLGRADHGCRRSKYRVGSEGRTPCTAS